MLGQLKTILDTGGPVMYVLLAFSLLSLTLIFERAVFWTRTHAPSARRRLHGVLDHVRRGDLRAAHAAASAGSSVYARFSAALLEHTGAFSRGHASEADALELVEQFRPEVERFHATLSTIITAAPMIGILGTVVGIIQSFRLFGAETEINDPASVAGGIATALYTTAFGLVVALITLFPFALFRAHADRCFGMLETIAAAIIHRDGEQGHAKPVVENAAEPAGGG